MPLIPVYKAGAFSLGYLRTETNGPYKHGIVNDQYFFLLVLGRFSEKQLFRQDGGIVNDQYLKCFTCQHGITTMHCCTQRHNHAYIQIAGIPLYNIPSTYYHCALVHTNKSANCNEDSPTSSDRFTTQTQLIYSTLP
jgi:hypothetical protein